MILAADLDILDILVLATLDGDGGDAVVAMVIGGGGADEGAVVDTLDLGAATGDKSDGCSQNHDQDQC